MSFRIDIIQYNIITRLDQSIQGEVRDGGREERGGEKREEERRGKGGGEGKCSGTLAEAPHLEEAGEDHYFQGSRKTNAAIICSYSDTRA